MRRWFSIVLVLVLVVSLGTLIACAPDTEPPPDENDVDDPDPDPVDPDEPQRVVIGQESDVRSWDPPQDWISAAEWITQNAYDYLFIRSAEGGEWIPELAYDWEVIDDLTFRFYLEEGVEFHDGTELTAEDVKFHYRRIIEGTRDEYIVTDQYDWIDEIIIHDDYTFDVVAVEPNSLFLWQLAQKNTGAGIVSKDYFEEVGLDGVHREPMGTGPWTLKEWVRDEHVLMERNENYWQEDKFPNYEELEYRVIPEASTRVAELLTGGVDIITEVMPEDKDRIDENTGTGTEWVDSERGHMLSVRTGVRSYEDYPEPDFAGDPDVDRTFATEDPRVRKAIEHAIDKYALQTLTGGTGEAYRARGPFKPLPEAQDALYGPDANVYDPEKAEEILRDAGYEPGEPTLVMHSSESWPHGDMSRVIADMLEQVGFDVDLNVMDHSTWQSDVYLPGRTQELNLLSLGGQMNPYFSTNQIHYDNVHSLPPDPELDPDFEEQTEEINELLEYAWTEVVDDEARIEAYHEATKIAATERYANFIGLFQTSVLYGISDRVNVEPRHDLELWGYDIEVVE